MAFRNGRGPAFNQSGRGVEKSFNACGKRRTRAGACCRGEGGERSLAQAPLCRRVRRGMSGSLRNRFRDRMEY